MSVWLMERLGGMTPRQVVGLAADVAIVAIVVNVVLIGLVAAGIKVPLWLLLVG